MAITYTDNGGGAPNGSDLEFTYSFPVLQTEDVKVALNGVTQATTKYAVDTASNPTKIIFNATNIDSTLQETTTAGGKVAGAPKSGVTVRVYRRTTVGKTSGDDDPKAVFAAGSSIRAVDLNANTEQGLYAIHELQTQPRLAEDIADDSILSSHIKDGEIVDADINASADIANTKIADGLLKAGLTINSANIVNGSIVDEDINATANIQGSKLANDSVALTKLGSGSLPTDITVSSTNIVNGTIVDADVNVSADIQGSKLLNDSVTLDKLGAGPLPTDITIASANIVDGSIVDADIATGTLDNRYYTKSDLDGGQLDNRYYTEVQLNPLATNPGDNVLDARYFTETESDTRYFRQDSTETIASGDTWSGSDLKIATTGAIDLRVIDLIDDVGGFVPIANETSFPTSNPDVNNGTGTIVSITAASTDLVPSGTTVTIANGRGSGLPVVITNVPETIPSGYGFLVETKTTAHEYTFHRLVPKATEVSTIAANAVNIAAAGANVTDIHNFADLYQISTSAPTQRADGSNLTAGDLWYDSSSNKVLMIYDGSSGDGFTAATPNASDLANIAIVAGQITFTEDLGLVTESLTTQTGNTTLNTVAGIATDVTTVAGIQANVTAVAADATDIGTVAGKATEIGRLGTADAVADMNTLGTTAIVSDMDTLADISSDITTVAGISSNVTAVAGNATNINAVNSNSTNINAVNANSSNINTVSGINADVTTVAGISSNVTAVAGNATNINAVAADATDIGAVAGKATEIGRLGTADAVADLAILGTTDVVADMNTLATSAVVSDMDTLADISTNITSVANIDSNVTTVAGIAANVTTAAGNNAAITTVAGNNANITTVANANSNVSTVAGSIANVNTAASNVTDINTFANRYRIASSDPGTNNDQGDLYFNTTSNELRVYNGSSWQGGVTATGNLAGLGSNTFTGAQTFISSQTFDGRDVSADGAKLDAITTSSGAILNGVTATTQSASDNSTKIATTAYTDTAIANLVDSSPGALNTLNELAAAIGDDANFSTTITNSLATKLATNGDGSNVTNLNASNIASGTIAAARVPTLNQDTTGNAATVSVTNTNTNGTFYPLFSSGTGSSTIYNDVSGALSFNPSTNILTASYFAGNGSSLSNLNASNISSGTISSARIPTLNQNTTGSSGSCTGNAATASNASVADTVDVGNSNVNATRYLIFTDTDGSGKTLSLDGHLTYNPSANTLSTTWFSGNFSGNGANITSVDAATLDGIDSSSFLRSDQDDSHSGSLTTSTLLAGGVLNAGSSAKLQVNGFQRTGPIGVHRGGTGSAPSTTNEWLTNYAGTLYWGSAATTSDGKVWTSANDGSGSGLDADTVDGINGASFLRSDQDDTCTHTLTVNKLEFQGVGGNSGAGADSYAIYQQSGGWSHPYPDLIIAWHTGLKIGGHKNYGGTRFYNDSPENSASEVFSIANGDDNVRVENNLYVGGRTYIDNTTNYLAYPTGDYGSVQINGSGKNGWEGFSIDGRATFMHDGSTGTGIYNDANNQWLFNSTHGGNSYMYSNGTYRVQATGSGCSINGALTASGNVTAYSDARLKTNVKTIDNALDIVDQLRGVSFDWKESGKHSIGVIAQEVEKVLPELVTKSASVDPETKEESDIKSVDYGKMVGVLINAIKELKAEVEELKGGK